MSNQSPIRLLAADEATNPRRCDTVRALLAGLDANAVKMLGHKSPAYALGYLAGLAADLIDGDLMALQTLRSLTTTKGA